VSLMDVIGIVADQPPLSEAQCVGWHQVFDEAIKSLEAQQFALSLCKTCRELDPCKRWAATLSNDELNGLGVVAGTMHTPAKRPRSKPRTPEQRERKAEQTRERRARQRAEQADKPAQQARGRPNDRHGDRAAGRVVLVRVRAAETDQAQQASTGHRTALR
jgi:hypothetical protein